MKKKIWLASALSLMISSAASANGVCSINLTLNGNFKGHDAITYVKDYLGIDVKNSFQLIGEFNGTKKIPAKMSVQSFSQLVHKTSVPLNFENLPSNPTITSLEFQFGSYHIKHVFKEPLVCDKNGMHYNVSFPGDKWIPDSSCGVQTLPQAINKQVK